MIWDFTYLHTLECECAKVQRFNTYLTWTLQYFLEPRFPEHAQHMCSKEFIIKSQPWVYIYSANSINLMDSNY